MMGSSVEVQWLRLSTSTAESMGTKILHRPKKTQNPQTLFS